jgi:hypothetical protein
MSNQDNYTRVMLRMLIPMVVSITLPLIMLDTPVWLITIINMIILSPMLFMSITLSSLIPFAYHIIKPILYIWALVVTILGKQDFLAITFYILMGIQIPKMLMNFIGTLLIFINAVVSREK